MHQFNMATPTNLMYNWAPINIFYSPHTVVEEMTETQLKNEFVVCWVKKNKMCWNRRTRAHPSFHFDLQSLLWDRTKDTDKLPLHELLITGVCQYGCVIAVTLLVDREFSPIFCYCSFPNHRVKNRGWISKCEHPPQNKGQILTCIHHT